MRRIAFAAAGAAIFLVAPVVAADNSVPDPSAGRFRLAPADTGFTRLDTATGAITHCDEKAGRWFCRPVIEDGSPLAARLDALSAEVARLSAAALSADDLAAIDARLDALTSDVAALTGRFDGIDDAAAEPHPNPAVGLAASAVDKLLALVAILKHGSRTPPGA